MTERRCGLGGRVAGMCAREEIAAEEDEDEIVESVRLRSLICRGGSRIEVWTGSVATERAEDTDVRLEGVR